MNKLLYIFLFINLNCFGQEIKITFCDILSKEAVENVHIISNDVVYISNNEGNVFLSMNQNHSNLLNNDSYFFLKEIKDTIFLKSKNIILNEIIINSKKKN